MKSEISVAPCLLLLFFILTWIVYICTGSYLGSKKCRWLESSLRIQQRNGVVLSEWKSSPAVIIAARHNCVKWCTAILPRDHTINVNTWLADMIQYILIVLHTSAMKITLAVMIIETFQSWSTSSSSDSSCSSSSNSWVSSLISSLSVSLLIFFMCITLFLYIVTRAIIHTITNTAFIKIEFLDSFTTWAMHVNDGNVNDGNGTWISGKAHKLTHKMVSILPYGFCFERWTDEWASHTSRLLPSK